MNNQNYSSEYISYLGSYLNEAIVKNEEEFEEVVADILAEITEPDLQNDGKLKLPTPDEMVSEVNGIAYRYSASDWPMPDYVAPFNISFFNDFEVAGIKVFGEQSKQIHDFLKLLTYFWIPGKNPFVISTSFQTTRFKYSVQKVFCGYLFMNGYLVISEQHLTKSLDTITAEELRTEIRMRIKNNTGRASVQSLVMGIVDWIRISHIVALPRELSATFTLKDLYADGLSEEVARYCAAFINPYRAIEFDDLVKLLKESQKSLSLFTDDVIFLHESLEEIKIMDSHSGRKKSSKILINGPTGEIAKAILGRKYGVDPDTGMPWFSSTISQGFINKRLLSRQITNVENAAIFVMLLWTAMRRRELAILEIDALFVDGVQITGFDDDVLAIVRGGSQFNLKKLVSKPSKNHVGEYDLIPVPQIAAEAFALLIVLRDESRKNNCPTNANARKRLVRSYASIYSKLRSYCDLVGVKRYYPHNCRKTLPTLLINENPGGIELIRDLLGHLNIIMTRRYLMSLPGVSKEVRNFLLKSQRSRILEFMSDAAQGYVAGSAGDRSLDAVVTNPEAFKGTALPRTIETLLKSFVGNSNFNIVRTPMAWCLKFESIVSFDAPCLPQSDGNYNYAGIPNYDKCVPHLCKYAGHARSDLGRARGNRSWAKKSASDSRSRESKAYFEKIEVYWAGVSLQLELGRPDVVGLNLAEEALHSWGAV